MTVDAETLVKIKALQAIRARTVKRSWAPQAPLPKQREFLDLDCLEAFYGGVSEPVKKAGRPKKQVEQDEE